MRKIGPKLTRSLILAMLEIAFDVDSDATPLGYPGMQSILSDYTGTTRR